jgi:Toprim domain
MENLSIYGRNVSPVMNRSIAIDLATVDRLTGGRLGTHDVPCPPAMIAAFGLAHEVEPGMIAIAADAVRGVHITRLLPDGSDRERGDKPRIMIGHSVGAPLVLAPPSDMAGLAITEGIEDALTMHEVTGLGAWAAGSASRLPGLADAIPDYIDCVTVVVDDDPDGHRHSATLADQIRARGIEVRLIVPNRWRAAS